jgi:hypothetical protein
VRERGGQQGGDVHACKGKGMGWMMYSLCPDLISGFGMNGLVAVCNMWRSSHSSKLTGKELGDFVCFCGGCAGWTDLEELRNLTWLEMKL